MTQSGGEDNSFAKILFKREGGGNKTFYVTADHPQQQLSFDVVRYNFKETSYVFRRSSKEMRDVFGLVSSILSGGTPLAGILTPVAKPTGTWVHLFAVTSQGSMVEITDRELCARLMPLETFVEAESPGFPAPR